MVGPMPDVTYYGHWICPFAKRVKFTLANRGIAHDEVAVPPTAVRPKDFEPPPEFVRGSPRGEIPMIRMGETLLPDSIPILVFLEDRIAERPMLPAPGPERDAVLQRVGWLDAYLMMSAVRVYYGMEPEWVAAGTEALAAAFAEMEARLGDATWLAGEVPTLAESIAVPIYVRLEGLRHLGFEWEGPGPNVRRHMEACAALPGWPAVAWSPAQEDEFVGRFMKAREIHARRKAEETAT